MRRDVFQREALDLLKTLPDSSIDLVYVDPPFGTGNMQSGSMGTYADPRADYRQFIEGHLVEFHRVLKRTGALCLHLDWHKVHIARLACDDVFGEDAFLNEVIWAYDFGGRGRDRWPRKHDNILVYAKVPGDHTFNWDDIERIPYMAPGLQKDPARALAGKVPTDVWWMSIVGTNSHERLGYPSQKPVKLVERFVVALSPPEGIVLDCFAGSGTTAAAAMNQGRQFIVCDNSGDSIATMRRRFGDSVNFERPA